MAFRERINKRSVVKKTQKIYTICDKLANLFILYAYTLSKEVKIIIKFYVLLHL